MPAPAIRALEPRFVFDGAAAPAAAQAQSDAAAQSHSDAAEKTADTSHADAADKSSAAPAAASPASETASTNGRHEIVVIDKSVADWQTLLAGVPSSAEVILIDPGTDGFDKLADALQGRSDIDAIHILSHGSAGDLHLGSAELTAESIQGRYAADLAIIGRALTATGDILIYGCDFAAGETGARAADLLAQATGADVAASDDATGDTALGGDWDLEVHDGSIETGIVISDAAQHEWHHLLAPVTISINGDPTVKDANGNAISTGRASGGFTYYDVNSGVVNATALWQNVGTADGVAVDLRATVISRGESDDAVSFASANNNAVVLVRSTTASNGTANNAAQIVIKWEVVRHSDGQAVSADINFRIGDIDGIGSQPNTRESVTPSQFGLVSYTLASTTDLRVDTSNDRVRVSGTENENTANPSASPDSQSNVQFNWNGVTSWVVTYDLAANSVTGGAAFQHDGHQAMVITNPVTKLVPKVDLDADDSSGATGYDYKATYTEKGSAATITDTDPLISNSAATVQSATIVLTNAQAGDRLNIGTLPGGLTASSTTGSGTITVTITGDASPATYQAAMRAITFDSTSSDPNTVDRIIKTHVTSDNVEGTSSTTTVTVVAVDDPPVNTVPVAQTTNEDTSLVFSAANGTAITIDDVDARGGSLTTTLSVLHGVISLGSTAGVSVTGNGTGTVTVTGTIAAINAALNGTTYTPATDYNGADTLTVSTTDNGNTGTGGAKSDTDTVAISVTPVNDAPVNGLPAPQTVNEDTDLVFSAGNGNRISVSDVDAGASDVSTTVSVLHGSLTLGTTSGLTTVSGDGSGTVVLTGSLSAINSALNGLRYRGNADYNGADTLTIVTNDNGNSGTGGAKSDTDTLAITVTAVNDAPINTVPSAQTVDEDTDLVLSSANGNAVTVSDIDAGGGNLSTTLSVQHGTLTLGGSSNVTVSGNGTGSVTLTGTIADINAALNGTVYRGVPDYNGADTLTVSTTDNGNAGTGGAKSDTDTVAISVTPVNDAPVNGLPAPQTVDENTDLVFSTANGNVVAVSDVDAGTGNLSTTLSVQHGTLTLGGTANVTVSGDGMGSVTLTGKVADINAALNGTVYRADANYNGADTLTIVTDDNGNTGAGGAKSDTDTLAITVIPVNDPPANTVPGPTQALDEDTSLVFSAAGGNGISVSDPDDGTLTVTLSSAQGVLTLSRMTGLTFLQGDGTRDGTLQFSGTIADINAALEGLRFDPNADVNGAAQIALSTQDAQGATASSTIALSIAPVADIVPDSVATDEDTAITFNALTGTNGASADSFESPAAYVSSVTQGTHGSVSFLADGTMTYTPVTDFNGTDSFTYTVTSGGTTETAIVTVTVRPVNDAPVLDLSASGSGTGYATGYTERAPGVAVVGGDVSVTDIDSANMTSAKVVITNGSAGDTLAIEGSLPAGISASFDPATYTLTLTGSATKTDYQAILQQVRFSSDNHDPSTVTRTIAVTVNDGGLDSNAAATTVTFAAVNDPPVNGVPAGQSLAEDTPLVFSAARGNGITIADVDARGGSLSTVLSVGHGTLTLGSRTGVTISNDGTSSVTLTGTLAAINAALDGTTYRPDPDYNGSDSLTVLTNDNGNTGAGGPQTDTDTIALTIAPANDAPRAGALPALGSLDGDIVGGTDLGRYFSDVDGDVLRFSAAGLPQGLAIDPVSGLVSGRIDRSASQGGNSGDYTVTITADDGQGGLTSRSFTWRVVDPAPTARNDEVITAAATPVSGSVFADNGNGPDSDPDGDPLSIAAVNGSAADVGRPVTGSAGGRFTVLADGSYRFDPGSDFADLATGQTRTTRITYMATDGEGRVSEASFTVTVTGSIVAPPVLAPTDGAARDGDAVDLPLGSLFPNPDDTTLTYGATGLPPGLSIDPATGVVTGTIDHAASGADGRTDYRITITATDPQGATETRDFTYRVTNPAPNAVDDAAATTENMPVTIDALANDNNLDGDPLVIVESGDAAPRAGHGQVSVVGGRLVYTPNANFNGIDTITYSISDGNGGISTASVSVTVTPVNQAPDADTLPDLYGRDGDAVSYDVSSRFHDPDTDPTVVQAPSGDRLSFTATGLPPGLAIDPATGVITGTLPNDPAPVSHYTVTVTATDAAGASVSCSFGWTVSDTAPLATPDTSTIPAGSPVIIPVTSNDADPSSTGVHLVDEPGAASAGHGSVSVDPATGLLTYVPVSGFSGRDTIVYTIENANGDRATGILTVTVTPVNQRPTAPDTLSGRNGVDGQNVTVPLGNLIIDPDGDPLTYSASGLPPGLGIDPATGRITGTIDHAASGPSGSATYVVTLTATDPSGLAVSRSLSWTVTNPVPVAADDAIATAEDTPVDIDVTSNDHDPDGDPLSVVAGSAVAAHGTVTINTDGTLHYVPGHDFNGSDRIVYTITDGNGGFATASVTVTVTPVNDAPVLDAGSPALANHAANDAQIVSIPAGSAFYDIDRGDRLTFGATGLPPGLSIDPATGLISGTLASDASTRVPGGVYTITLTGTDLAGASATAQLTLTVANPSPIAVDDVLTTAEDTPLTGTVLANDHDPDGDVLHVEPVTGPAHGHLDLRPDGTFTYTPDVDFRGADSFTYALVDSDGGRAVATVHLTVTPVNDAPVAAADPLSMPANTVGTGRIVASDRDDDPLSFRLTDGPTNGTVTLAADGRYAYTPYATYSGPDRFTVEVSDGHGGLALATVEVTVTPNPIQVPPTVIMPGLVPLPATERPAAPPVQPPASSIAAEGIVLPAVAGIESLQSIGDVVLADGAVVAAVNGVAHLHGTVIQLDHPVMLEEGQRIARMAWERFDRMPIDDTTWFSPRPYLGRSLGVSLAAEEFGFGTSDLMVEAIRRPDTLSINLHGYAARLDSVAEVRLLGLDGAPPPRWIEGDGLGGFWGRPPAGTGIVRFELEIVLQDGRIVRRALSVDAETGEIRALPKAVPAGEPKPATKRDPEPIQRAEVPLFSAQLAALDKHAAHDMDLIERALTRRN
ncbi:tandem-95 repeat protein [Methylobacterium sp. C25]|uniref:Ig-like domain-containing protein n=1 Tax=Methylobacterium sp. C25 TaxID=2721622 RepID=UPI001F1AC7D4|nr:tandem-95 repeat protein [Methylobacterium sp. C25]MCE4224898.1 tandem-95 repeat protein [Methylobacterium sp. C25]